MSVYGLLNGGGCTWIGDSRGWGGGCGVGGGWGGWGGGMESVRDPGKRRAGGEGLSIQTLLLLLLLLMRVLIIY